MMAAGAIDLDEVGSPEIRDPRQIQGLDPDLGSQNVLRTLADLVNPLVRAAERDVNPVHVDALGEIQLPIHQLHLRLRRQVVSPSLEPGP
jgi:hypothetical protein